MSKPVELCPRKSDTRIRQSKKSGRSLGCGVRQGNVRSLHGQSSFEDNRKGTQAVDGAFRVLFLCEVKVRARVARGDRDGRHCRHYHRVLFSTVEMTVERAVEANSQDTWVLGNETLVISPTPAKMLVCEGRSRDRDG